MSRADRTRGRRRGRRLLAALVILLVLGVGFHLRGTWEAEHTMLAETSFATTELSGELRVVQITDVHNLPRSRQIRDIAELARAADPHLIAITGDLLNTYNVALDPTRRLIDALVEIGVPIYFVDGNHDHWSADHDRLHELLTSRRVKILDDRHETITGPWGQAVVIGVDDYYTGAGDLAAAVAGAPDGFRLVLTHSPEILPHLGAHGVDYAMCGHTHGGQIRLPLIGALYQPRRQFFPRISKGAYTDGGATLYIDSGVGVTGPPYRLFNQSQITLHRIGPGVAGQ